MKRPLVIAIFVKNKCQMLPLYLDSILAQTELSDNTIFYIRTNDNNDDTPKILEEWVNKWKNKWEIFYDDSSINPEIRDVDNKSWTWARLDVMTEIRNKSIEFAISKGADYFTADVDNICLPHTIETIRNLNLPVIAPMLQLTEYTPHYEYTNLHYKVSDTGHFVDCEDYHRVHNQEIKGILEVPLVHCTYFIRNEVLPKVRYDEEGFKDYEYVIFSRNLRKEGIPQYFDNREIYGRILREAKTREEFMLNYQSPNFVNLEKQINISKKKNFPDV
jgi:hypothetical protein